MFFPQGDHWKAGDPSPGKKHRRAGMASLALRVVKQNVCPTANICDGPWVGVLGEGDVNLLNL